MFYLCCVHTTGCRIVNGMKITTLETCVRGGGYFLCCAGACAFPPDDKVPMGCGCCGLGMGFDHGMKLEGTGMEWTDNEICCHNICCCYHCAVFKQFPRCCGSHYLGTACCFAEIMHCGLDPVDTCMKSRSQQCCVDSERTFCPRPCWPYCMFADEPCCC